MHDQDHPVNPSDEKEFDALKDDGRRYVVGADALGPHEAHKVVSAKELGRGSDLNRLVKLGALIPMTDDDAKAHVEGEKTPKLDQRADPRFATGGTAPAPAPVKADPKDKSGPVREGQPSKPGA